MSKPEQVVQAYIQRFPNCGDLLERPGIDDVEALMRPFAPISHEVQHRIDQLFHGRGLNSLLIGEHAWWEADFAVSGDGSHHDRVVRFLCRDPCTCVTPHLPAALAHARREVDVRILALMRKLGQLKA